MSVWRRLLAASVCLAVSGHSVAAAPQPSLPAIESDARGRHALIVDGAPFLMLGAQANNSSNDASVLPQVWDTIERLHANTLEMPVSWEQVEPVEGRFDFTFLDTLLAQARTRNIRLVLLWFGTWKNGGAGYAPEWVRTNLKRFPRKLDDTGQPLSALSPFSRVTLEADRTAFTAMMRHLAARDAQNTVIMVQVENEAGAFGIPRDRSPAADKLFDAPVPSQLAARTKRSGKTWRDLFGPLAEPAFMSWYTARYIDEIAAAGKAVKSLPMYCNAALSDPFAAVSNPKWISSGSPDWNMIDIWKAAAPHIDLVAPDIYTRDWRRVDAYLAAYSRPDNALFVPEIGNAADYARFFWAALGRGAIGYAPFGMDATGYVNYPLGAKALDPATIEAFSSKYAVMAPMARGWARLAATHDGWGVAKDFRPADQSHDFGDWRVTAQFDRWFIGDESWTFVKTDPSPTVGQPVGGVAMLHISDNEFIVIGSDVRIRFARTATGRADQWQYLSVEEGKLDDSGKWIAKRMWHGDQTDYGINLPSVPVMLRVRLGMPN